MDYIKLSILARIIMRVQVVKEAIEGNPKDMSGWKLCFQWCNYVHDNGEIHPGYRFIWRLDGQLKPYRGQTKIGSINQAEQLMNQAKDEGWGDYQG